LPFFFFRMNRCSRTDTAMLAICLANVSAKPLAKTGVARGRGMGSQPPLDATETVETWRPNVRPRGEPADPAPCSSGSLPQMAAPSEVACSTSLGGVPLTVGRLCSSRFCATPPTTALPSSSAATLHELELAKLRLAAGGSTFNVSSLLLVACHSKS
jgi:hypothetical protein